MAVDSDARHRRSIRLPGYDYASAGAYFVTIVAKDRECLLEDPVLSEIVEQAWLWLNERYLHVLLDEYVVMPNHFHGILVITDADGTDEGRRGGSRPAPTDDRSTRKPLAQLIGAFKTVSAKHINLRRDSPGVPVWQRNYYDRIIRNEDELNRIRQYILDNPANWNLDPENPVATGESTGRALFSC